MDNKIKFDTAGMKIQIKTLLSAAEELKKISNGIPAIEKNTDAILSFAHILEMNVPDIAS